MWRTLNADWVHFSLFSHWWDCLNAFEQSTMSGFPLRRPPIVWKDVMFVSMKTLVTEIEKNRECGGFCAKERPHPSPLSCIQVPDSCMYIHKLAGAGLVFQDGCVHIPQLLLQMTPQYGDGEQKVLVICGPGAQKFCIKMSVEVVFSLETRGASFLDSPRLWGYITAASTSILTWPFPYIAVLLTAPSPAFISTPNPELRVNPNYKMLSFWDS